MQDYKLNKIFQNIFLKKQYINQLKNKIVYLGTIKKNSHVLFSQNSETENQGYVKYIVDITFSKTNTLLHLMDCSGNLQFFCSAGSLNYKGKKKTSRLIVLKQFYQLLISKLKFLRNQPVALHFKNVQLENFYFLRRKLRKKLLVKIVKVFNNYSYNGCRKKKIRKKKIRTKKITTQKVKKWLRGLRRQTVNLLSFLIVGSNPTFFKLKISKYNAAVACLFWEQEVMCSNHIISIFSKNF